MTREAHATARGLSRTVLGLHCAPPAAGRTRVTLWKGDTNLSFKKGGVLYYYTLLIGTVPATESGYSGVVTV